MIEITVCVGSTCYLKGSCRIINKLIEKIKEENLEDKIVVKGATCLGNCSRAVSVKINDGPILSLHEENLQSFFEEEIKKRL